QYADPYIPWLMEEAQSAGTTVFVLTGPGTAVAVGLMFVYSLINIMGVKLFAHFNNVLVWWKLAIIALVVAMFFFLEFNPGNLTEHGFAPSGWGAMLTAIPVAGVAFSFLGFRNAVEYAGETKDPQRNVPYAVIGAILLTMLI